MTAPLLIPQGRVKALVTAPATAPQRLRRSGAAKRRATPPELRAQLTSVVGSSRRRTRPASRNDRPAVRFVDAQLPHVCRAMVDPTADRRRPADRPSRIRAPVPRPAPRPSARTRVRRRPRQRSRRRHRPAPESYTSHPLLAGFVTEMRSRGVPDHLIARQTRHNDLSMLERYWRPTDNLAPSASALAGQDWW